MHIGTASYIYKQTHTHTHNTHTHTHVHINHKYLTVFLLKVLDHYGPDTSSAKRWNIAV